ncbi:pantoate--beta-alanine ligase [Bacteroidota bacterium]
MHISKEIYKLKNQLSEYKKNGLSIGFVPTMGALHDGHLSLITESNQKADKTIVSIFVNPTQFNEKNDFINYPRNFDKDINVLQNTNCDILFLPSKKEMYPEPDNREFELGYLEKIMEGKHRQGHFQGVAKVVTKLFDIVEPDFAFFGQKDFQQIAVIKKVVYDLNYKIKIIPCEIIRESDGLAMSSRNQLLNNKARQNASFIYNSLLKSQKMSKTFSVSELKKWIKKLFKSNPLFKLEYFEIVNENNLNSITSWNEKCNKIGCIAAWLNGVRLIDNIKYNL